jgi:hypothetical protein
MLGLRFRDALPPVVLDELENIVSKVKGFFSAEHNDDGTHGDITADSVTLHGGQVGELIDLPFNATRYLTDSSAVWTVSSDDQVYLRYSQIGRMAWVEFWLQTTVTTVDVADSLLIRLPELHPLRAMVEAGVTFGAQHTCGSFQWADLEHSTAGMGYVIAQTINSGGYQAAVVRLVKNDAATFAVANNYMVRGFAIFPLNTDNAPIPF